jgi:hypothetical protein
MKRAIKRGMVARLDPYLRSDIVGIPGQRWITHWSGGGTVQVWPGDEAPATLGKHQPVPTRLMPSGRTMMYRQACFSPKAAAHSRGCASVMRASDPPRQVSLRSPEPKPRRQKRLWWGIDLLPAPFPADSL